MKPKFRVGEKVNYHGKEHTISRIMDHPKGYLYMFEDIPCFVVLEGVLTGELESQCSSSAEAHDD